MSERIAVSHKSPKGGKSNAAYAKRDNNSSQSKSLSASRDIFFQRNIGNQSISHLHHNTALIQPKLNISQPDDVQEKEADQVADRVMRMSLPGRPNDEGKPSTNNHSIIQRQCAACQQEEDGRVQLKAPEPGPATNNTITNTTLKAAIKNGRPLTNNAQNIFSSRFGVDFSSVRVHTSSDAARSARDLNARIPMANILCLTEGNIPLVQTAAINCSHMNLHMLYSSDRGGSIFNGRKVNIANDRQGSGLTFDTYIGLDMGMFRVSPFYRLDLYY